MSGAETQHRKLQEPAGLVEEHSKGTKPYRKELWTFKKRDAGMSSGNKVRILTAEYPRFQGKADLPWGSRGPKGEAERSVADGQQVRRFLYYRYNRTVGTQKESTTWNGIRGKLQEGRLEKPPFQPQR